MAKYKPTSKEERLATYWDLAMKNYDPTSLYPNPQKQSMFQVSGFNIDDFKSLKDPDPMKGLDTLLEERAQNQSTADKWGNALVKMGITAGTTFLDGTIGTIAGLTNMAIEGEGSAFWNNKVSKYFSELQEWSEEAFPNYYTQSELEKPWYENLITANFWADKVLKNMGFMIGTVASSAIYGGMVRNLAGAKNITKNIGKGLIGKTLKNGKVISNADEGLSAYLRGEIKGADIVDDLIKEGKTLKNIDGASQLIGSIAGSVGEARIEALQSVKEYAEKRRIENPDISEEDLAKELTDLGNSVFLSNMAILSVGNYVQFKNAIGGGYKPNKLNFNNMIKGDYIKGLETALAKTKSGKILEGTLTGIKALKNPVSEGMEEQFQKIAQEASTLFYGKGQDEETEEIFKTYLEAFADKTFEQFGSIDNWEDFFVGFISAIFGAPTISRGKPILAGGIWDEISEFKEKKNKVKLLVDEANKSRERISTLYNSNLRNIALENEKQNNLALGDKFKWENDNHAQIVNDINTAIELGRLEDFKEEIKSKGNISSEEIKTFFEKEGEEKSENRYDEKDENYIRKELNKRIENILKVSDRIEKTRENLKIRFPNISNEVLNEISYYEATEENLNERSDAIASKISELTKFLDGRTAQEIAIIQAKFEGTENYLESTKARLNNIKSQINKLNNKYLKEDVELIKKKINSLKESIEISDMFKSFEGLSDYIDGLSNMIDDLSNESSSLEFKALELKQKTDFSPITINKKEILLNNRKASKRLIDKANNIINKIKDLNSQLNLLNNEKTDLENRILQLLDINNPKESDKEELKKLKEKVKNIEEAKKTIENLLQKQNEYKKIINNVEKRLEKLNKEEEEQRNKIKEVLKDKEGITYEEYEDKVQDLMDKKEKFSKQVENFYKTSPQNEKEVKELLEDLRKIEKRKRIFIGNIANAYKTNGINELQDAIDKFNKDKIERKNKKEFDAKFVQGKTVLDKNDNKTYKVGFLNNERYLFENNNGKFGKVLRKFEYTEGILNRYEIVESEIKKSKESINIKPIELNYEKQNIDIQLQSEFDIDPKKDIKILFKTTTGNIGEVKDDEIILNSNSTDLEDVIAFQNFIDTTKLEDFQGKKVSGKYIYGDNWENKKKELISKGYANPEDLIFIVITDKNENDIIQNNRLIYTSLNTTSAFVPLIDKPELKNKNELILTRNEKGEFTSEEYNKKFGTSYNIVRKYPEFTDTVKAIKAKFFINKGIPDINIYEKNAKSLLENLGKVIKFSSKSQGKDIKQKDYYNASEYLTDNNLTVDDVELQVLTTTDNIITNFGTYVGKYGFTYLIDKVNERVIPLKPRELNDSEKKLVKDLLITYTKNSKIEDGKIDTSNANIISDDTRTYKINEILNILIGFGKAINGISDKNISKKFDDLNKEIYNIRLKIKKDGISDDLVKNYNKKIKELQEVLNKFSTNSRSIYFQRTSYIYGETPGGFITIGIKDGKPNTLRLFNETNDGINTEVLDALDEYLKTKWFNINSNMLNKKENVFLPTKIENGKVKDVLIFSEVDGYKKMLLGEKSDTKQTNPVLQTRVAKKTKGKLNNETYNGKLPSVANRYLILSIEEVKPKQNPINQSKEILNDLLGEVNENISEKKPDLLEIFGIDEQEDSIENRAKIYISDKNKAIEFIKSNKDYLKTIGLSIQDAIDEFNSYDDTNKLEMIKNILNNC